MFVAPAEALRAKEVEHHCNIDDSVELFFKKRRDTY